QCGEDALIYRHTSDHGAAHREQMTQEGMNNRSRPAGRQAEEQQHQGQQAYSLWLRLFCRTALENLPLLAGGSSDCASPVLAWKDVGFARITFPHVFAVSQSAWHLIFEYLRDLLARSGET
ncbi:unnamed protein product, partial [Amoebophrya sp. A25]